MSSRTWQLRIQDILNAIDQIQQRLDGYDFETFAINTVLAESIVYQFIIRYRHCAQICRFSPTG